MSTPEKMTKELPRELNRRICTHCGGQVYEAGEACRHSSASAVLYAYARSLEQITQLQSELAELRRQKGIVREAIASAMKEPMETRAYEELARAQQALDSIKGVYPCLE
jgi:hypothetical protein